MAEYIDLIGKPFAFNGRGPDAYDCYGLMRELLRRDGIEVPDYDSPTRQPLMDLIYKDNLNQWAVVREGTWSVEGRNAAEFSYSVGDCLHFTILGMGTHVGYIVARNKFIHAWEGGYMGVVVERIDHWVNRILGVYRYAG